MGAGQNPSKGKPLSPALSPLRGARERVVVFKVIYTRQGNLAKPKNLVMRSASILADHKLTGREDDIVDARDHKPEMARQQHHAKRQAARENLAQFGSGQRDI